MSQHDYVIANAGGAAVRSDINSALLAVQSNNAGATAPSATAAGLFWLDTSADPYVLKIRDKGNNNWLTVGEVGDPGADGMVTQKLAASSTAIKRSDGTTLLSEDGSNVATLNNVVFGSAVSGTPKSAVVYETQASGTNSSSNPASTTWKTLVLNAGNDPDGLVALSSNRFTLQAGSYLIQWASPAFADAGVFQSRLYNYTGSAALGYSTTERQWNGGAIQHHAYGAYVHEPSSANVYEIQQQSAVAYSLGFGNASSMGPEIYTVVTITKY